jgi:hypothetical protein
LLGKDMRDIRILACWAKDAYWGAAIFASALYGIFAVEALEVSEPDKKRISENRPLRWHQRWLNFLGSLAGWSLGYIVIEHVRATGDLRLADFPVAFLGFVGMTGHLPYVVKHVWKWNFPWGPKQGAE